MKIHLILDSAFPYGTARTARGYNYAKGFVENGVECEVIIPKPLDNPKKPVNPSKGIFNGVPYHYASLTSVRKSFFLLRRLIDITGLVNIVLYILIHPSKDDIIMIYSTDERLIKCVLFFCHLRKLKVVFEFDEYPYVFYVQSDLIDKKRQYFLNHILPKFDGILAISENLLKLSQTYSKTKMITVPILVDPKVGMNIKTGRPILEKYIFHSGTLNEEKDGVCGMLIAFAIARKKIKENLYYVLTGNLETTRDKGKILKVIDEYGIRDYVRFVGYLSNDDLRKYQYYSSLVIINKLDTVQNKYCFATKLGEYLAFSKPILTTNVGEATKYLVDGKNAYVVKFGNPLLLAEKIVYIIENPDEASEVGKRGYELLKNDFNYKVQTNRIIEYFKTL